MSYSTLNRRKFLQSAAATFGVAVATPSFAATDFKLGGDIVTALSDGYFDMPTKFFIGATTEQQKHLGSPVRIGANAYLRRSGKRVFLFDSGAGNGDFIKSQFPTAGKVPSELEAIGLKREDITDVVITHMHPDHVGGVVYDNEITFPNATIHMDAVEWNFWTKEGFAENGPEQMRPMITELQSVARKIQDRITLHTGETDLGGGVMLQPSYGHTPGHATILLTVGNEKLLILGDAVVSEKIHFSHPDVGWVLDFDPEMAQKTRKRLLDQAVTEGLTVAGNHITSPGLGRVERDGTGYRFISI